MNQIINFVTVLSLIGNTFAALPPPECIKGSINSPKDPFECCKVQVLSTEVVQKCKSEFAASKSCGMECALNETKILVNGNFNKQAAITYVSQQLGNDAESKKIASDAIEFCMTQATGMKNDFEMLLKSSPPNEKACSMCSGYMVACVGSHIYKNCPRAKYTADAECEKIKVFADKCNMLCLGPKNQM